MARASSPLTALSEAQRAQALNRFEIIHPALEKEIPQAQLARIHEISLRTVQRRIKNYRVQGLTDLADAARSDKGTSCSLPQTVIHLIEGLVLQTSPRSAAAGQHHRQRARLETAQLCSYTPGATG